VFSFSLFDDIQRPTSSIHDIRRAKFTWQLSGDECTYSWVSSTSLLGVSIAGTVQCCGQAKRSASSSVRDLPLVVQSQSPGGGAHCPQGSSTALLMQPHHHRHHCCCAGAALAPGLQHQPHHHHHHAHRRRRSRSRQRRSTATDCSHAARRCRSWLPTVLAGEVRIPILGRVPSQCNQRKEHKGT